MIRPLLINAAWAVFAAALFFLAMLNVPVRAGEPCAGTWVRASWYGLESCHPHKRCQTAQGVSFNGKNWIVAHKTMRFGTMLKLSYQGRSVTVPVADRGPYIAGRTIDLSRAVAKALGTLPAGVATVCMTRL